MTIDERFQRIERVTAWLAEAHHKEREEARVLWRNTQRQIDDLTYKLAETRDHIEAIVAHLDKFIAESAAGPDNGPAFPRNGCPYRQADFSDGRVPETTGQTSHRNLTNSAECLVFSA